MKTNNEKYRKVYKRMEKLSNNLSLERATRLIIQVENESIYEWRTRQTKMEKFVTSLLPF